MKPFASTLPRSEKRLHDHLQQDLAAEVDDEDHQQFRNTAKDRGEGLAETAQQGGVAALGERDQKAEHEPKGSVASDRRIVSQAPARISSPQPVGPIARRSR